MSPKVFASLLAAAIISVMAAIALYGAQNRWAPAGATDDPLLPALSARPADVTRMQVTQGERTLTFERTGETWGIAERSGFPVKPEPLRALLVQAANLRLAERKTANPQRHDILEVEEPTTKAAKSRLVRFLDAKGGVIAEVIAGKARSDAFGSGKPGTYVRRPGDAQAWLASGALDANADIKSWLDRRLVVADAQRIATLSWSAPGAPAAETYRLKRTDAPAPVATPGQTAPAPAAPGPLAFEGIPSGKKLKPSETADGVARAYSGIEFEDVRRGEAAGPETKIGKASLTTADGVAVNLEAHTLGDATWIALAAAGAEGPAKSLADTLNARVQGWQFKLGPDGAKQLFKTAAELFEGS